MDGWKKNKGYFKINQKISAHTIVKNEARWIWYTIMSVIEFVDEYIIFDTGSNDGTNEIIETIDNPKIKYIKCGEVSWSKHTEIRNKMLDISKSDWVWVIDGDEVYPYETAKSIVELMRNNKMAIGIIVKWWRCVGDIYLFRQYGDYTFFNKSDNWSIRAWNRNNYDISWEGDYWPPSDNIKRKGEESLSMSDPRLIVLDAPKYFHFTHLARSNNKNYDEKIDPKRSTHRIDSYCFGLGVEIPDHVVYPEVFYIDRPSIVPLVTKRLGLINSIINYINRYLVLKSINYIKRRLFPK